MRSRNRSLFHQIDLQTDRYFKRSAVADNLPTGPNPANKHVLDDPLAAIQKLNPRQCRSCDVAKWKK
jgi:hypothetical protein